MFDDMQLIRNYRRSKWRTITIDIASILGSWLLAFVVASFSGYDRYATSVVGTIVSVCTVMFAWNLYVVSINKGDFQLTLTTSRLSCHSPNERLCPSFDLKLTEINEIANDDTGALRLVTSSGSTIDLALARNFGAPINTFVEDMVLQNPRLKSR